MRKNYYYRITWYLWSHIVRGKSALAKTKSNLLVMKYGRILCQHTTKARSRTFVHVSCPWRSTLSRLPALYPRSSAKSLTTGAREFINKALNENAVVRRIITHPIVSSIHVNSLSSNIAMEDRHSVHMCPQTGVALLTVIDGHVGCSCAEHIKQNIATYVSDHLNKAEINNVTFCDIFENPEIGVST